MLNGGEAAEGIERLGATSAAVAEALAEYLDEHGLEIASGIDLDDRTVAELPETLMGALRAGLERPAGKAEREPGDAAAALRARVPAPAREEFDRLLAEACALYELREDSVRITIPRPTGLLRRALLEAGRRLAERGVVEEPEHVFQATEAGVRALLGGGGAAPPPAELARRVRERQASALSPPPTVLGPEEPAPPPLDWLPGPLARVNGAMMLALSLDNPEVAGMVTRSEAAAPARELRGIAASAGRYRGRARVVLDPAGFDAIQPGDVLIAPTTSPAYNVVLPLIGAVVTDRGGMLSHAAIVAREYGIPAVVGTGSATADIRDGTLVLVDGDAGVVKPG